MVYGRVDTGQFDCAENNFRAMQNKSKHVSLKTDSFSRRKRKTYLSFPIAGNSYCETRRIFKCFAILHEDTITGVCRRHFLYHNDHIIYKARDVNRAK